MINLEYFTRRFKYARLPEVETVRNSLKEIILNQTIRSISINYNKIIKMFQKRILFHL